jgi:hypothetical protein
MSMFRVLTDHKVAPQDPVNIEVLDEPGAGGACHDYLVSWSGREGGKYGSILIHFQNGPIKEAGVNGLTQEVLLAIVLDRLNSFQAGPFACRENAIAKTHVEEALMWLQKRTRDRVIRGVEGTSKQ